MVLTLCCESVLNGVEGDDLFEEGKRFVPGGSVREVGEGRVATVMKRQSTLI
jgi:hypothetical protein